MITYPNLLKECASNHKDDGNEDRPAIIEPKQSGLIEGSHIYPAENSRFEYNEGEQHRKNDNPKSVSPDSGVTYSVF